MGDEFFEHVELWPGWLKSAVENDQFFRHIDDVILRDENLSDADLEVLKELKQLAELAIDGASADVLKARSRGAITDAGLANLRGMNDLKRLDIRNTRVTDAGLCHLKGLTTLESLLLMNMEITGPGLENLAGLHQLEFLSLWGTDVSDSGLDHLKGLSQLKRLDLERTKVTAAGVKRFQQALPNCEIRFDAAIAGERQSPAAPDQLR
jgi:internalin A